ncbi:MAG TPA: DUF481 domain-containing protein, partial [Opitutaceae bacterium]|nr:DUF481 domain-containing protein [Opitutaceae bacterium]
MTAAVARADDWLEFKNGERVTGHYVKTVSGVIYFDSSRFGLLHIPVTEAGVTSTLPPPNPPPPAVPPGAVASVAGHAFAMALAPQTTAVPPTVAVAQRRAWKGRIDTLFDFIWANNNSSSRETKVQGTAERLSGKEHYLAYTNVDYLYNEHLLVQNRLEGRFTWEHQLSHSVYSIAEPDYLHEIRQSPTYQYQLRTGVGTQLFQTNRSQVRLAVLAYFSRIDVPADHSRNNDIYPTLRLDSQWEIWRGLKFTQEGNAFYIPRGGTAGVDNTMSLVKDIFGGITLTLQH